LLLALYLRSICAPRGTLIGRALLSFWTYERRITCSWYYGVIQTSRRVPFFIKKQVALLTCFSDDYIANLEHFYGLENSVEDQHTRLQIEPKKDTIITIILT
jgi:hypothetical protein